jgi:hypothetical protein
MSDMVSLELGDEDDEEEEDEEEDDGLARKGVNRESQSGQHFLYDLCMARGNGIQTSEENGVFGI